MTFSLVGMCRRTGMFGAAVTTSSIGVGSRCPYARAGVGAVLTQHRTDPALGPRGLDLLEAGRSAQETVDALVDGNPTVGWRQLAVVDRTGTTALFHGDRIVSIHGAARAHRAAPSATSYATTVCPRRWSTPSKPSRTSTWRNA